MSLAPPTSIQPDTILVAGDHSSVPCELMTKLGYRVIIPDQGNTIAAIVQRELVDLILVAGSDRAESEALLDFFRSTDRTREVPCLVTVRSATDEVDFQKMNRVATILIPFRAGLFAGRVATQLRLRKIAGAEDQDASLAEMNASLRDLTQRFTRERDEAKKIQQSLLPKKLPTDARFEIAAAYEPLEEVGGDWYYVSLLPDGTVGLYVADVTGHGLAAAFICTMTKLAIGACNEPKPAAGMTCINRLLAQHIPEGRFITMGYVRYAPDTGTLAHSRAGHPPALVLHAADGQVRQLLSGGLPLGFLEDAPYGEDVEQLQVGDAVLLYTDGVTEAMNRKGEQFGLDRLGAALREGCKLGDAGDALRHIFKSFNGFRDGRLLKDDVTIVLLRRKG